MDMSKNVIILLSVILLQLATSCNTTQLVTFETLQPAQSAMPSQTEQVLFVNRLTDRSCRIGNNYTNIANEKKMYKIECDTLQQSIPSKLYSELQENFYFPPISYVEGGVDLSTATEFPIITFDAVTFDTNLSETSIADYLYYVRFEVCMQAILTLHPALGTAPQSVLFRDTISWDADAYTLEEARELLPSFDDALSDCGEYMATSIATKFSPYHTKTDRVLFVVPSSAPMRDGYNYWITNKPQEASYLWEYAYSHSFGKKRRAMAANNVALCYELQDNLNGAIKWLEKALQLLDGKYRSSVQARLIEKYLQVLNKRVVTDSRVVDQLQE